VIELLSEEEHTRDVDEELHGVACMLSFPFTDHTWISVLLVQSRQGTYCGKLPVLGFQGKSQLRIVSLYLQRYR
jgi:hypothetical protein